MNEKEGRRKEDPGLGEARDTRVHVFLEPASQLSRAGKC